MSLDSEKKFSFTLHTKKKKDYERREHRSFEKETRKSDEHAIREFDGKNFNEVPDKMKPLVIPLIKKNRWQPSSDTSNKQIDKGSSVVDNVSKISHDDLERKAISQILKESQNFSDSTENETINNTMAIPLLLQNQVPEGFETEEKLNVALRPDEPDESDYNSVPIEQFGMALLRGMGWKEGRGVGRRHDKTSSNPIEPVIRPQGMGLGADRAMVVKNKSGQIPLSKQEEEEKNMLDFTKGTHAVVTLGPHEGSYGTIEGIDGDMGRVFLHLCLKDISIGINQNSIELVTPSEFKKYSKYINKVTADKMQEETVRKMLKLSDKEINSNHESPPSEIRKHKLSHHNHGHHRHQKRHKSPDNHGNDRNHIKGRESKDSIKCGQITEINHMNHPQYHDEYGDSHNGKNADDYFIRKTASWLRTNLRVRIIDNKFDDGKYYREKVDIIDILEPGICVCRTSNGRVLEQIRENMVETVIPRSEPGIVMIISRNNNHYEELGQIIHRDRKSAIATLQLLSSRETVLRLPYDEVCEFIGDVNSLLDY